MPVKLNPPGQTGGQAIIITGSSYNVGSGTGTTPGGETPSSSDLVAAVDGVASAVQGVEAYPPIPDSIHARNDTVMDGIFIDPDVRYFANSLTLSGNMIVRANGYAQIFTFLDNSGVIDNFSVIDIGIGG